MAKVEKPGIGEDWLTTNDAAALTGYTQAYMRQLALRGLIPAVKAGRDWLLERKALVEFAQRMQALGDSKHNPWKEDREDLAAAGRGRGA